MSKIIAMLLNEMDQEAQTTRKVLAIVPEDKYDWKPHAKNMPMRELALHIPDMLGWVELVLKTDELDFAKTPYQLPDIQDNKGILQFFEERYNAAREALANATEEDMEPNWTLREGEAIYHVESKAAWVRSCFCQVVHHRAQLGMYLRLLNVPIPGSYGPSADEMEAMMAMQQA